MVMGAYYLAKFGHRFDRRKEKDESGNAQRYFEHVRRVAILLMDIAGCYDPYLICVALLHDALEDTQDLTAQILERFFGPDVARRVRRLSKVPKEGYVERLKIADLETILVKACDRLDNLLSLGQTTPEFQEKQLKETRIKYLPLFMTVLGPKHPVVLRIHAIVHPVYPEQPV